MGSTFGKGLFIQDGIDAGEGVRDNHCIFTHEHDFGQGRSDYRRNNNIENQIQKKVV